MAEKESHSFKKPVRPKYNMWQNSWFMIKLAWTSKEKKVLVLCLLSATLAVALNLVHLYVSPIILGAVERHAPAAELLSIIAAFVLGMMLLSAASAYVKANTQFGRISVRGEVVTLLAGKAAATSYPNVDDDNFQKLQAKSRDCVGSNSAAAEAIWDTLTELTSSLLGFLIYASLLTTVQPFLILVILATASAGYFIGNYLNGYGYRHREEEAEYARHLSYISSSAKDLGHAKDIRIFGIRPWLEELHLKTMDTYTAFHRKAQGIYLWAKVADLLLTFLRNAIAYAYLITLVIRDGLGVADFLLYFTAASGFTEWVSGILEGFHTLYQQSLDISTVRECLDFHEPFLFDGGEPVKAAAGKQYEIRLENVSFRYSGSQQDALSHINLTLHPGEKLAVVGLNGAGKTTLVKLICGFLDPTEGRVLLDGRDIRDLNRRDYYTLFSAVFPNFSLLAGSIAVNVAQTETDIDMERVKKCVEEAGLLEKIASLPEGSETCLNREVYEDAVLLSGGETQRLMLARALYKEAPFLLLDEPTAALDPIAESELYRKYHDLARGRSSVYISHRLASTRFCDRILLVEDGEIKEEGTHDELLRSGGRYAELFEIQSKYYQEGDAGHEKGKAIVPG